MSSSRPSAPRRAAKPPRKVRPPRRPARAPREWELIDQLPSALPITQAEIEVLDKMLGAQIDAILKG
ncbi:hypothetical protein [Devosia sp.]|uniref:hypothetical protein n=1 Tax=Devosia sp. TaxID=1871048 RepID=UPI00273510B7|nr:hypothetical protein [Devosia sp.]MDP2782127.1 hypothetical protein [Devosia sp.]